MSKYNLPKTFSLCDLSQSDLLNCSFQPPQSILLPDVMETESGFFSFHLGIHFLRCFDLFLTDRTKVERSFCYSFSTIPADCNIPLFFFDIFFGGSSNGKCDVVGNSKCSFSTNSCLFCCLCFTCRA